MYVKLHPHVFPLVFLNPTQPCNTYYCLLTTYLFIYDCLRINSGRGLVISYLGYCTYEEKDKVRKYASSDYKYYDIIKNIIIFKGIYKYLLK